MTGHSLPLRAVVSLAILLAPVPAQESTYAARVESFWGWFSEHSSKLHAAFDGELSKAERGRVLSELSKRIDADLGMFGYETGRGVAKGAHHLALTGDGDQTQMMLIRYWAECAPKIAAWEFYAGRQRDRIQGGSKLSMGGRSFKPSEVGVEIEVDQKKRKIHLRVHHPAFPKMTETQRGEVAFIMLDGALGEHISEVYIGGFERSPMPLENQTLTMDALWEHVSKIIKAEGWDPDPALDKIWTVYKPPKGKLSKERERSDIVVGSTCHVQHVNAYWHDGAKLKKALKGTGTCLGFLRIDFGDISLKKRLGLRNMLGDHIEKVLAEDRSARVVGFATGHNFAYVDVLFFDLGRAVRTLKKVAAADDTALGIELVFFDDGILRLPIQLREK